MSGPESLNAPQATQGNAPLPLCNRRKEEAWPCGCSSSRASASWAPTRATASAVNAVASRDVVLRLQLGVLVYRSAAAKVRPLSRLEGLVVFAEDLSQHVLFFRLDDGFLPARPGERLKRVNRVPVSHDDEFGPIAPAAPAPGHMGASRLRLHHRDAGFRHEALELVLLSRMNPGAKHSNDHQRPPSCGLLPITGALRSRRPRSAAPLVLDGPVATSRPISTPMRSRSRSVRPTRCPESSRARTRTCRFSIGRSRGRLLGLLSG
jgi:hypothetical protein